MRDDFNKATIDMLSKRVGAICSNPDCRQPTSGPSTDLKKSVNIGVAAHIRAASEGGPRYEKFMSSEQRADISNGIWLCQSCSKLIDADSKRYTVDWLKNWKNNAERNALERLESGRPQKNLISSQPLASAPQHDERLDLSIATDSFLSPQSDVRNAAARMALALHDDKPVCVVCEYPEFAAIQPIDDGSVPDALNSIELAAYRQQKARKGKRIASAISLAFSRPCFEPWGLYLQNASDWCELLISIPKAFSDDRVSGTVEKLSLWRTDEPTFRASIRLTENEVQGVLETTGQSTMEHLAFGAGWRSADELPRTLILSKVLPNILRSLASAEIDLTALDLSPILNLPSWHIGRD